jgi:hypothetical protein
VKLEEVRIFSQGDVMHALNSAPKEGKLSLEFTRNGERQTAMLELAEGWKKTDLKWRPSMRMERMPK